MKIDICKVVICEDGGNPLNESAVLLFLKLFILISNLEKCLRYVPFLITLRFFLADEMKKKNTDRNTVVGLVGCRADVYQSIHSQEWKVWWETFRNAKSGSSKLLFKLWLKRSS